MKGKQSVACNGKDDSQLEELLQALRAVRDGDFSIRLDGNGGDGIMREIAEAFNEAVRLNEQITGELVRINTVVGLEGNMEERASMGSVSGGWKTAVDSINSLIVNLAQPTAETASVLSAVARGDLSRKIAHEIDGRPLQGEFLRIGNVVNTMVDQLSGFASEVTRVAREVGTDGKLGGQAQVMELSGVWKDLTDSVNAMAGSLTSQVRNIAEITTAVAQGDLSKKITVEASGEILELKDTINKMVDQLNSFASEVTRVAREVGTDGKLGGQAYVRGVSGVWKDLTDNVNQMGSNLTHQVRNIALVTTAVANGDLSRTITVEAKGEILELKDTINRMVDQLNAFASEVTRVAREVGTDGKLGGQAQVKGVAGVWKDLTDNVNAMAGSLTSQVRDIAKVTIAVANGDLSQKITVDARGEILELKDTINRMVDQLNAFGGEVTRVAREVGTEGKLGGQAQVKGISGVWKDLTDNVNQLAGNLTIQVRAIADVATAVSRGDLSRSITVEAFGEVADLKDNVNQMIITLRETTRRNEEQDWLKTNLARFTRMLQGERDLQTVSRLVMSELTPLVNGLQSVFYVVDTEKGNRDPILKLLSSYAYIERKNVSNRWSIGEGLVGQCALEKKPILLTEVPDNYIRITSGLGESAPRNIIVLPVLFEGQALAVVEIASFSRFSEIHLVFLEQLMESLGVVLNMIQSSMRTEELLKQSQELAEELQTRQEDLKRSNEELEEQAQALKKSQELLKAQREELRNANDELEDKAAKLQEQKRMVEIKNRELELTQASLEEKAEQLAVTSKYKSEFLANMSHELRTPLNSLLLLAGLLAENKEGNLTAKQVEYLSTVHSSGQDLLSLINEILDLSKIEAGRMEFQVSSFSPDELRAFAERSFRQPAEQRGLDYRIVIAENLPPVIRTDQQRLEQILRNLLSNAFKFTESGSVILEIGYPKPDAQFESEALRQAGRAIAFSVRDTGIGIKKEKQKIIWEAFQQVDATTSRKYGGTGLGLTISREIARLLGGEIHLESEEGIGSIFTLYLPVHSQTLDRSTLLHPEDRTDPDSVEARKSSAVAAAMPGILQDYDAMDDRYEIEPNDRVVLIIEDDESFAGILKDIAHERDFKAIVAHRGDTGLALANEVKPDAIVLDLKLPVMDGWTILERLKSHAELRHIPVHIISALEERRKGLSTGAVSYLTKPVDKQTIERIFTQIENSLQRKMRRLLVAQQDGLERDEIAKLIGDGDVEVTSVSNGAQALEALKSCSFDCAILDLMLPDMNGIDLLEKIFSELHCEDLPVIVYTLRELSEEEHEQLRKYSDKIIVKGSDSQARLLDETALFLHRVESRLPAEKQRLIRQLHEPASSLIGKKILIIDDDVRNIFALTSVLESRGIQVLFAENGMDGISALNDNPDIDLILMDIMMPGMDGYETTRLIRLDDSRKDLPIVALTAKAMKGDREKCLEAGASDYISKPVDTGKLLSLLQVWLYK